MLRNSWNPQTVVRKSQNYFIFIFFSKNPPPSKERRISCTARVHVFRNATTTNAPARVVYDSYAIPLGIVRNRIGD